MFLLEPTLAIAAESASYFTGWGFAPPWYFEKKVVQKRKEEDVRVLRRAFVRDIRDDFFDGIVNEICDPSAQKTLNSGRWYVHHWTPLGFIQGTNEEENLKVIHATPHNETHLFMNMQLEGLLFGEAREIWIPSHPGCLWGLFPPFERTFFLLNNGQKKPRRTRPTMIPEELLAATKERAIAAYPQLFRL